MTIGTKVYLLHPTGQSSIDLANDVAVCMAPSREGLALFWLEGCELDRFELEDEPASSCDFVLCLFQGDECRASYDVWERTPDIAPPIKTQN